MDNYVCIIIRNKKKRKEYSLRNAPTKEHIHGCYIIKNYISSERELS